MRASPIDGRFGHRIKIVGSHLIGCGFVMIATNRPSAEFADLGSDFVGVGAVSNNVAEADDAFPLALDGIQRGA